MIKYSIVRAVVTTMLGLICAWTVPLGQAAANAAEVKILAAVALASALDELTPCSNGPAATNFDDLWPGQRP